MVGAALQTKDQKKKKKDTTGKPSWKGRKPGETRTRSAQAIERRILRGAAKRAESLLSEPEGRETPRVQRPEADELDYSEGLRLQAVPEQAVPDFLNSESVVVGGLPSDPKASGATKRVWSKFAEKYPKLSDVLQKTPGAKARKSFAQEEGGRRVAQGVTPLRGATPPTTVPPGSLKEESAVSDRTLTHPPTSVWYSVDEGENFQEEAKSEAAPNSDEEAIREAKKQSLEIVEDIPQSEVDWGSVSSQSASASQVARAVQDLELQSNQEKGQEHHSWTDRDWYRDWSAHSWEDRAWASGSWWKSSGWHRSW